MAERTYRSNIVTFVSAGMLSPKKRDHALARRQLYLNYGALSLATKLELVGYDVALLHGEHRAPKDVLGQLEESERFPSIYPLMVSVPSFYALPWAQAFCKLAKLPTLTAGSWSEAAGLSAPTQIG